MTKLCARGKAAAKRKFRVYPSAYANAYASKICAGKIKDPSGLKRKDFKGPKPAGKVVGGIMGYSEGTPKFIKEQQLKKFIKEQQLNKVKLGLGKFDDKGNFQATKRKKMKMKIGGEAKVKEVAKALHKASSLHKAQAKALDSVTKANVGIAVDRLKEREKKDKRKKYNRPPQSRDKMQPSRSMSIDTTTKIEKLSRGGGAAIRGMGFKGVF